MQPFFIGKWTCMLPFGNFEIAEPVNPETIYNYYNYIDTEEICQLIGHQNST